MMKSLAYRLSLGVLLTGLALGQTAYAQERFSALTGNVTDESGAAIPGATVTLTNLETKRVVVRTTGTDGTYQAQAIEPGRYSVRFELSGFASAEQADVNLLLGQTLRISASLKVGTVTETIQVLGESPLIDIGSTLRGSNIPAEEFEKMPKGRSFESLAAALPSVTQGTLENGISVNGSSSSENSFTIDGVAVNSLIYGAQRGQAVFEHLQEVQVKTSGLSAEFGGALGGVISAVTKSGGNDFKGSAVYYFSGDSLRSTNGFAQRLQLDPISQNTVQTLQDTAGTFKRQEVGLSLGGPIVKDKLWFFASSTQVFQDRTRNYNVAEGVSDQREQSNFGKITWEASSRLRVNVSGLHTPTIQEGVLVGFDGTSANASTQSASSVAANNLRGADTRQWSGAASVDYFASNSTFLSLRTGYFHDNYGATGISKAQTFEYATSAVGLAGVPAQYQQPANYSNSPRVQGDDDLTTRKYANLELSTMVEAAGSHNLKIGGGWSRATNEVNKGYPNGGFVTLFWDQAYTSDATGQTGRGQYGYYQIDDLGTIGETGANILNLFIQDSWKATPRLTLDLGLRLEKEDIPTFRPDIQKNAIEFGWGDKIAPRVGIAYDVKGDGRMKASASYGRYFDWTKYELARGSFGGDTWTTRYRTLDNPDPTLLSRANLSGTNLWTNGADTFKDNRIPGFGDDVIDPDIKPMGQDVFSAGVEYQMSSNTVFSANVVHTNLLRTIEDVGTLVNGSETYLYCNPGKGLCKDAFTVDATPPFEMPEAIRKYTALELSLNRRFNRNWFLGGSYVLSKLRGNYNGTTNTDEVSAPGRVSAVAQQSAGTTTRPGSNVTRAWDLADMMFDSRGNFVEGILATDRTHVIKLYGNYRFDVGTNVGVSFFAGSGTPVTTNVYDWTGVPVFVEGRGDQGRTPFLTNTNLFLSHDLKLGDSGRLVRLEFNVINAFNQKQARHIFDKLNRVAANGRSLNSSRINTRTVNQFNGYDYEALLAQTSDAQKAPSENISGAQDPRFGLPDGWNPGFAARFSVRFIF